MEIRRFEEYGREYIAFTKQGYTLKCDALYDSYFFDKKKLYVKEVSDENKINEYLFSDCLSLYVYNRVLERCIRQAGYNESFTDINIDAYQVAQEYYYDEDGEELDISKYCSYKFGVIQRYSFPEQTGDWCICLYATYNDNDGIIVQKQMLQPQYKINNEEDGYQLVKKLTELFLI